MASYIFICVKCLATSRIVGYIPPDFDNICEDCKSESLKERITRKGGATKPSWKEGDPEPLTKGTPLEATKSKT